MSRETQYYGLTKDADDYIDSLRMNNQIVETLRIEVAKGIAGESVMGKEYHCLPPSGPNKTLILRETAQPCGWSSGPIIICYLQSFLVKEDGHVEPWAKMFKWVVNPRVENEIDYEKGHYWV